MQLHARSRECGSARCSWAGEGEELEQRARAWMAEQGVARPDRIAAMFAPLAPTAPVPPTREME